MPVDHRIKKVRRLADYSVPALIVSSDASATELGPFFKSESGN